MAARFLLIDGYNLIHAAGFLPDSTSPGALQRSRERLYRVLRQSLDVEEQRQTCVVFDARCPPPGRPATLSVGDFEVCFATEHPEADDLLERLIAVHSAPALVSLISSDRRIQRAALRRRCEVVTCREFLHQLRKRQADRNEAAEQQVRHHPRLTPSEMREWLGLFEVDIAQVLREPPLSEWGPATTPAVTQPGQATPKTPVRPSQKAAPRRRVAAKSGKSAQASPPRPPVPVDAADWLRIFGSIRPEDLDVDFLPHRPGRRKPKRNQ